MQDHPRDVRAADDSLADIVFYSLLLIINEVCRTIPEMFFLQMTRWQVSFCPVRVNPVYKIPISKSLSKLATPVETPAKLNRVC